MIHPAGELRTCSIPIKPFRKSLSLMQIMISDHMFMALVSIFIAVIDEPIDKKKVVPDVEHCFSNKPKTFTAFKYFL